MTLDGEPLPDGANIWAEVWDDGLRALCSYPTSPSAAGRFTVSIAGDAEVADCGAAARQLVVVAGNGDGLHFSQPMPWPGPGARELDMTLDSSAADIGMRSTPLFGSATYASGAPLPPGTRIDAYAGTVLCGSTSVPRAVMIFSNPDSYLLMTSSPDAVPGCAEGAPLTLRIDGVAVGTATNTLDYDGQQTDAVLPTD